MRKELKDKWTAALRSGEYKQAKDILKTNSGNCCLGVLCELTNVPHVLNGDVYMFEFPDGSRKCGMPSQRWMNDIGLNVINAGSLAEANDHGKTFNQIADMIDQLVQED